jgi:hypothetical protein
VTDAQTSKGAAVALRAITLYQAARAGRPTACRFHPSCSVYASEAVTQHGLLRGGLLAARRFVRCRPLGPHGIDEVPPVTTGMAR